jgi:oxygen-independent coproporphyrinogen-3 oxidase
MPALAGRPIDFVYFGGGTPSFLSTRQLDGLVKRLTAVTPWDDAQEITFECEPGTLTETKLAAIRNMGVTRLSLGVENFNDEILTLNGRAHRSPEVYRAYEYARSIDFPQINIDLIAGMLGETEENWRDCVKKTLACSRTA